MVKIVLRLLLFFEPYVKKVDIHNFLNQLKTYVNTQIIEIASRRAIIDIQSLNKPSSFIQKFRVVSRVIFIDNITKDLSLKAISELALCAARKHSKGINTFRVEVRRWNKSYPYTSLDISKYIGEVIKNNLGLKVDLKNPDLTIFIGINHDKAVIGYYHEEYVKVKKAIPLDVVDSINILVEKPRMLYEVMDLIQLSRAFNIKILLLGDNKTEKLLQKALEKLSLTKDKVLLSIIYEKDLENLYKNYDYIVALTPYAEHNEELLAKLAAKYNKILILTGNEYEDLSIELRKIANNEIRLGPQTQQPLRVTNAIAYTLGLILPIKTKYTKPTKNKP